MIFSDFALARRLETADAANGAACVEAQSAAGAALEEAAGGLALFVAPHSPLTHALGLGMNGPVAAGELDRVEAFFRTRGVPVAIDLCPYAHPSLVELVRDRGYRIVEFNSVLVLPLSGLPPGAPDPRIREAAPADVATWSATLAEGFFENVRFTAEELEVGTTLFRAPGTRCFLGTWPAGGPAAGGAMAVRNGLATLFGDATIARFRGAGLQTALIRTRLDAAVRAGGDLATAATLPGSISQRNYEKLGFRVVYTKVGLTA